MPKYAKVDKIEVWRDTDMWQDDAGGWHEGGTEKVLEAWANVKGKSYELHHEIHGEWGNPTVDLTITRPKYGSPELTDHVLLKGRWYVVVSVNELTGRTGRDMRLTVELDPDFGA